MKKIVLLVFLVVVVLATIEAGKPKTCKNGKKIVAIDKMTKKDRNKILALHNKARKDLNKGKLCSQKKAKKMPKMTYDKKLEKGCVDLLTSCQMRHKKVKDKRWDFVGQNLYSAFGPDKNKTVDWKSAHGAWINECKLYKYKKYNMGQHSTGHYTQAIWANTTKVGCNFVHFEKKSGSKPQYGTVVCCNYGPGGNTVGEYPYKV